MAAVPAYDFLDYLHEFRLADRDKTKPGVCYDACPEAAHAVGKEALTESLRLQKEKHQQKITDAKTEYEQRFKVELSQRYGWHPEIASFISFIKQFVKQLDQLDGNKSDIDSSSSTWKIDRFAKFIDALRIKYVQPYYHALTEATPPLFPAYNIPDDLFSSIQQRYVELASVYLGAQVTQALEPGQDVSFLRELQNCEFREATTRVFVDALITPILLRYGLQVRLEEKLYKTNRDWNPTVPNSIADYVIYSRDGEILGAIETKNGGCLKAESVIQCMLQLLALRRKAPHTLFGVVTDGGRYVFIVLTEEGTFEFEGCPGVPEGGCYDVNTWGDLRLIVGVLNWLLQRRQR